jgi:hypothetical protein
MYKVVTTTLTAAVVALGASLVSVQPAQAQGDLALNLCTYVQGDDRVRMRQRMREDRVRLRSVYSGILCNGKTLLQFAMENGSSDIGTFIVSQLPGSELEASGELEWAESNGHGDSEVAAAIRERVGG